MKVYMSMNKEYLALRLSASLLLKNKAISISDIKAFPFLDEDFDLNPIIENLLSSFRARLEQYKISSFPIPEWDEKIILIE